LSSCRVVLQVENKGIVMVVFYNDFVSCGPISTLQDVVNHIQHIRNVTGSADYLGIGSDFNGVTRLIKKLQDQPIYIKMILTYY